MHLFWNTDEIALSLQFSPIFIMILPITVMQNIAAKCWKLLRNMAENSGKREIKLKITEEQL